MPALAKINAIEKLPKVNDKLVFDVVCFDRQSGLCEITTKGVLGYTEQQVCELVNMYNDKLLKLEIDTAKKLAESDKLEIDDGTRRAKAILKNCCKITLDEARVLVSKIILAINAEIEKEIKMEDAINVLNTLKLYENDYVALANEIQKILIK